MSYTPDCADCPTPEDCQAKKDCQAMRQIRHPVQTALRALVCPGCAKPIASALELSRHMAELVRERQQIQAERIVLRDRKARLETHERELSLIQDELERRWT